jgi:hypothetical protein
MVIQYRLVKHLQEIRDKTWSFYYPYLGLKAQYKS